MGWDLGGRVLGFGPVLNSIIGVNSGGFSADARPTQRPTANASPPQLPPPSMALYPCALTCRVEPSAGVEMTKAYFSPLRKMMPPIGNSARVCTRASFLPQGVVCIRSPRPIFQWRALGSVSVYSMSRAFEKRRYRPRNHRAILYFLDFFKRSPPKNCPLVFQGDWTGCRE